MNITIERTVEATPEVHDLIGELNDVLGAAYGPHQRHGLRIEQLFEPNVRSFVARLDGLAVGCGGVAIFDDYAEVKRMYTHQWRVVGGSERFCCGGSRMRPVGQASRSRAWKRVSVSKRLSVFTSAWDFGYGVRSAPMRQCLPATSRPASSSKRCSGSSND